MEAQEKLRVRITVNGEAHSREVEARRTLADFLREDLGLTGTHIGCEHGVCGACTVLVDGTAMRSCLLFAAQLDGCTVQTVEGLSEGSLHPLQDAFRAHHALQCGYCTPGFLIAAKELLDENPQPSAEEVRDALSGQICRCTGYANIVDAVMGAAAAMRAERGDA